MLEFHVIEFLDENGGVLNKYAHGSKVLDRLAGCKNKLFVVNEEDMKCSSVSTRLNFKMAFSR